LRRLPPRLCPGCRSRGAGYVGLWQVLGSVSILLQCVNPGPTRMAKGPGPGGHRGSLCMSILLSSASSLSGQRTVDTTLPPVRCAGVEHARRAAAGVGSQRQAPPSPGHGGGRMVRDRLTLIGTDHALASRGGDARCIASAVRRCPVPYWTVCGSNFFF
jgi:hypothetical protein